MTGVTIWIVLLASQDLGFASAAKSTFGVNICVKSEAVDCDWGRILSTNLSLHLIMGIRLSFRSRLGVLNNVLFLRHSDSALQGGAGRENAIDFPGRPTWGKVSAAKSLSKSVFTWAVVNHALCN